MLTVKLEAPIGPQHTFIDPEPYFRLDGETLRNSVGGALAVYGNGFWVAGDKRYSGALWESRTRVTFEHSHNPVEEGPFTRLRIVDGSL